MVAVSTMGMALRTREMISVAQYEIGKLSEEVGSGIKRDVAAALGTRLAENISTRNLFDQSTEYKNNIVLMEMRMDMMANSITDTEKIGSDILGQLAVITGDRQNVKFFQNEAMSSLSSIVQHMNVATGDRFLFSGIDSSKPPLTPPDKVSATGKSPIDAMNDMFAANPITDAASAQAFLDYLDLAFSNDPSVPADLRYEGTFYAGTPEKDGSGNDFARVTGRIDQNRVLNYGVQANDSGYKDLIKGIYLIATADLENMSKDAYDVIVGEAFSSVSKGLVQIRSDQAVLGGYQSDAVSQNKTHENALKILNNRIVEFEGADLIRANAQMTVLETQLQASIILSNKLGSLSIASMMR